MSALLGPMDRAGTHIFTSKIPPILAADATADHVVFIAPVHGFVTKVAYIPDGANTGQATNYHTLQVISRKGDGSGTTAIGSSFVYNTTANNDTAAVARVLYTSTAGTELASGDVLVINHAKSGTGVALTAGHVEVRFQPS